MAENKFIIFSGEGLGEDGEGETASEARDRRRHQRHRIGVLTEIVSAERGKIPAVTFNMSASGAYLLTLAPLSPGDEVELAFISGDEEREVRTGRVVHGAELTRDMFWSQGIGVEFVDGSPRFFAVTFDEER